MQTASRSQPRPLRSHRRVGRAVAHWVRAVVAVACMAGAMSASAQTHGSSGIRHVKGYWFEQGLGMVIRPTQPFANPMGCTHGDYIWVLETNSSYKQMVAAVIHAKASNTPIAAWITDCKTFWAGQSAPVVHALGVDWD
jgi:hypothetical protein